MKTFFKITLIFILALSLRLLGLHWDQGQHLHPDERFLTMVASDIKLPSTIIQYFDTTTSPLNPYNYPNYQFFVYGTFPLFLVKFIANFLKLDNYDSIVIVGRVLSAVFDSLNIYLLYFLSKKILTKLSKYVYLPSLLYAFCVLPIQLSHFFTVDTFLATFLLAAFVFMASNLFPLAAIFFGLALACKISAIYFLPIIGIFLILKSKKILPLLLITINCSLITIFVFRIFQPYAFVRLITPNPHFIESIKTLQLYVKPNGFYPPSVQWLNISPLPFALQNLILWGIGLPLILGFLYFLFKNYKSLFKNKIITLTWLWMLFLILYQGVQPTPTMRYFLPIYPLILLLFVYLSKSSKLITIFIFFHLLYGLLFINIYFHPQTRVAASYWIYQNIAVGSTVTNEYWDDPLPLNVNPYNASVYNGIMISPYDPDSPEKMDKLSSQINSADYLFMSSNRLWHSIPSAPSFYPQTSQFYANLFAGKLNFTKILEINSYPGLSLPFLKSCYYFGPTNFPGVSNSWYSSIPNCFYPGIYLRDDTAEEAFTVYDHPKVLIFQKQK